MLDAVNLPAIKADLKTCVIITCSTVKKKAVAIKKFIMEKAEGFGVRKVSCWLSES